MWVTPWPINPNKKQQTEIGTIIPSINNYSWLFDNGKLFARGFFTFTADLQLSPITYHALLSTKRIPNFIAFYGRYSTIGTSARNVIFHFSQHNWLKLKS